MDLKRAARYSMRAVAAAILVAISTGGSAATTARADASQAGTASIDTARIDAARVDTARVDTARIDPTRAALPESASSDTSFTPPEGGIWTMDELKAILGAETEGFEGKEYRQRKNGRVAMACALAFPGLGQMYNEKPLKAAVAMGVETFYTMMIYQNRRLWSRAKVARDRYPVLSSDWRYYDAWVAEYWERSVDWIWWSTAALLVIVIDSYVDAHLDDMRFRVAPAASADHVGFEVVIRY